MDKYITIEGKSALLSGELFDYLMSVTHDVGNEIEHQGVRYRRRMVGHVPFWSRGGAVYEQTAFEVLDD